VISGRVVGWAKYGEKTLDDMLKGKYIAVFKSIWKKYFLTNIVSLENKFEIQYKNKIKQ